MIGVPLRNVSSSSKVLIWQEYSPTLAAISKKKGHGVSDTTAKGVTLTGLTHVGSPTGYYDSTTNGSVRRMDSQPQAKECVLLVFFWVGSRTTVTKAKKIEPVTLNPFPETENESTDEEEGTVKLARSQTFAENPFGEDTDEEEEERKSN
ncbi:hypothetical protein Ciccas_007329 [Cichlidogyrus casuarinus]|uniref:Uncharacterized protein n=1 Tax=Cichlidogyrus casuarinus TaxID=1844966 RepID=A0ABD2Q371_9PLAT